MRASLGTECVIYLYTYKNCAFWNACALDAPKIPLHKITLNNSRIAFRSVCRNTSGRMIFLCWHCHCHDSEMGQLSPWNSNRRTKWKPDRMDGRIIQQIAEVTYFFIRTLPHVSESKQRNFPEVASEKTNAVFPRLLPQIVVFLNKQKILFCLLFSLPDVNSDCSFCKCSQKRLKIIK